MSAIISSRSEYEQSWVADRNVTFRTENVIKLASENFDLLSKGDVIILLLMQLSTLLSTKIRKSLCMWGMAVLIVTAVRTRAKIEAMELVSMVLGYVHHLGVVPLNTDSDTVE